MKIAAIFLVLLGLSSCASMMADSPSSPDQGAFWHRGQVQRDVEAIMRGMNHARAQSEAVARARGS